MGRSPPGRDSNLCVFDRYRGRVGRVAAAVKLGERMSARLERVDQIGARLFGAGPLAAGQHVAGGVVVLGPGVDRDVRFGDESQRGHALGVKSVRHLLEQRREAFRGGSARDSLKVFLLHTIVKRKFLTSDILIRLFDLRNGLLMSRLRQFFKEKLGVFPPKL